MTDIKDTAIVPTDIFPEREFKGNSEPSFDYASSITVQVKGAEPKFIDTSTEDNRASFENNLKYWNQQATLLSANNFDNAYFNRIVEMGKDALPFILEELKKGPTPLVHALDLIFPGTVEYDGFVSIKEASDTWISILQKIGIA